MSFLTLTKVPEAKASMLIRKENHEVFEALINPEITTHFWFTKSTGKLVQGKHVTWTWEMYGAVAEVYVKEIVYGKLIRLEWPYGSYQTDVDFILEQPGGKGTYLTVRNYGFRGDGDKVVEDALNSTGGFTYMLAGLKAYLEHGIELHLVSDAFI